MSACKFSVEENRQYAGRNTSAWIIRAHPNPGGVKNADGTTSFSLNFPALVATDCLSEPQDILELIAEILNEHWDAYSKRETDEGRS